MADAVDAAEAEHNAAHVAKLEEELASLQLEQGKQADTVRALKAEKKLGTASATQVEEAIQGLAALKAKLETLLREYSAATGTSSSADTEAFRATVQDALQRRLFFIPSYNIYNGVSGLFDYGPPGSAVKTNLISQWRLHFVIEEGMLEIECPSVTPEVVLKASGHVDKFTDFMVRDEKTLDCIRADHLLKDWLEERVNDPLKPKSDREEWREVLARVDELDAEQLGSYLEKYQIKAPETGNNVTKPFPFNLMFETQIGPTGTMRGFLRPETAQGIFVNFRDLLYYNGNRLPFAAAQVGQAFRNEISPKAGLLRVREFTLAEIEHFVNPEDKAHPRFGEVRDVALPLFGRTEQLGKEKKPITMTAGEAVERGIIDNETLAYFIVRVYLFLAKVGIDVAKRLRFRQHLQHEMAHYASDCWDAEILNSYGWTECVGIADRSAYDLKAHTDASGVDLNAWEDYREPKVVERLEVVPDAKTLGKQFKKDAKIIKEALAAMTEEEALSLKAALDADGSAPLTICTTGQTFTLQSENVSISRVTRRENGRSITPGVIEPSFGIGRILYCIFEHAFSVRSDDAQRTVFSFSPVIAPMKCAVLPLMSSAELVGIAAGLQRALGAIGISAKTDASGVSIGKKYARMDEIGVPYALTIDPASIEDKACTIRERDSTEQVRVPIADAPTAIADFVEGRRTWADLRKSS